MWEFGETVRNGRSVRMGMRGKAFAVALMLALSACANPGSVDLSSSDSAEVMAAAMEQLVTEDNTFGSGPPPFTLYLIQNRTDPDAGISESGEPGLSRQLTTIEMETIEDAIAKFGPVQWIDDPSAWYSEDLIANEEGSVILGVGEPSFEGDTAFIPVSLWCGGLCGTWFTYKLERVDGVWQAIGIEGPVAIS